MIKNVILLGGSFFDDKIFTSHISDARLFLICKKFEIKEDTLRFEKIYPLEIPYSLCLNEYLKAIDGLRECIKCIIYEYGEIDYIIGNTEDTVIPAAMLREEFNLKGESYDSVIELRDKLLMRRSLSRNGHVRVPRFIGWDDLERDGLSILRDFDVERCFPVVVKPVSQAASRGVVVVDSPDALCQIVKEYQKSFEPFLVEKYIDHPVFHIDGVYRDSELCFISISRYIHNCFDWARKGTPMSSVIVDENEVIKSAKAFTKRVLSNLLTKNVVFHLEAFLDERSNEFIFLEIGGRVGGAGVARCNLLTFGVDLHSEALKVDLNLPSEIKNSGQMTQQSELVAGWIVTPLGESEPCRVTSVQCPDRLINAVTDMEIPHVGHIYNYEYNEGLPSGKFYLIGKKRQKTLKLRSIIFPITIRSR